MVKGCVAGDENIESGTFRRIQQLAVFQTPESRIRHRDDFMPGNPIPQTMRQLFVDQNPHAVSF